MILFSDDDGIISIITCDASSEGDIPNQRMKKLTTINITRGFSFLLTINEWYETLVLLIIDFYVCTGNQSTRLNSGQPVL